VPPLAKGHELELRIDRLSYGGRGVARRDGYVVFVPYTAPGDLVRVRMTRARRSFGEAEVVEVLEPSPDRVPPPCPYFGPCGGCAWQHLTYQAQLRVKEQIVRESLDRLGGLVDPPVHPIAAAEDPYHYRAKMEFAFHPRSVLGLHERGHFDRIIPIDACLLPSPLCSEILREVKRFVRERKITCYDNRTREGLLRHLVYREGVRTGEVMVGIITTPQPFPDGSDLAAMLAQNHPQIRSIVWAQSSSLSDAVRLDRLEVLHGHDHIFEELGGLRFAIRLETFFQTNTPQAEHLATFALEMAELRGNERVVDLYCGVGTFALLLAPHVAHVWGIEVVPAAIEAARENAALAGTSNVEFLCGDARRVLPDLISRIGTPDLLLLDPPRSGAGGKVMRAIGRAQPQRVIYISCNPTTLAPDLRELIPFGYEIRRAQPVDLFPQTYHVETLVRADRVR
jgi:23S rRNA (uracil1939-C5)-methyltransferase